VGGALASSMVGCGYAVDREAPKVTVRTYLGRYHVCVKEAPTWAMIVAECMHLKHAELIKREIEGGR